MQNFYIILYIMKFLRILLYCLLWLLFAVLFTFLGVILVYIWQNWEENQNYIPSTITLNVWTWDKSINQLPTLKTMAISFPLNISSYECSKTNNITVKVSAIEPNDPDGMISRLKFYYYNVDDPDRILEYKETMSLYPYVYFVLPKISWEYGFWVILYDNNWWIVNSDDIIWKWPALYMPHFCGDVDLPTLTLKVDSTNVEIWDTVTFNAVSRLPLEDKDFEKERIFYYDFEWDWTWDLVTKKDTVTYTFIDVYEEWVTPRAAVEFRWKLVQAEWAKIRTKIWLKPILMYNSIWNTVIFRDMSRWALIERQICFEDEECAMWNNKFRKLHSANNIETINKWTATPITQNDAFIFSYDNYWEHDVSIYEKDKYWNEKKQNYIVDTSLDKNNWWIASWVNMITIPETTFTNANPEIFLSKTMKNTLIMYINNENWELCYVDTEIAIDSDWDWKSDNDKDIMCNKLAKIKYEPEYESAWWRVYFMENWKLTFKNFYVTFEWIILELDEEKREIYNDITALYFSIEDISTENINLKRLLDSLRKNLNNRPEVSSLVISIKDQINNWWIKIDLRQKESLDAILSRLDNEDTIISVWRSEYDKNKAEILSLLPTKNSNIKSAIEEMFKNFDENLYAYPPKEKAKELKNIRNTIINNGKKNNRLYDENDFTPYFCNIFDYFDISNHTNKC